MKTETISFSHLARTGLLLFSLAATALEGFAQNRASTQVSTKVKPTIVLVHGAWADGSSWNKVIPLLLQKGYQVVAVQNPLTSLDDDVAAVNRILAEIQGEVILVGHSWGGVVITQVGNDPKVKSLVYVAAYAPNQGESVASIHKDGHDSRHIPNSPVTDNDRIVTNGFIRLKEETVLKYFAQDLPKEEARLIAVSQGRFHVSTLTATVSNPAWKSKPSFYVVADQDQIIPPQIESYMAKQIGATTYHVSASHVPMLSQPQKVAEVILAAAEGK